MVNPSAYSSRISTDIPLYEIPGASFDHYLEDKLRVFKPIFLDKWRSQQINETYLYLRICNKEFPWGPDGLFEMSALKSANKELKGMMKTVKIQDIDNLQDEMMDLMDVSNEIQESLGRSYNVPDDIDEDDLMGELDALEADMGFETEGDGVPSYLQPDKEPDLEAELNLPSAPTGQAPNPAGRVQAEDELGLPAVPRAFLRG